MITLPEELKEYFDMYYEYNSSYNIPKNVNIYLLEEREFKKAIEDKTKEVFKINTPVMEDTLNGLIIVDTKNKYRNTYNIFILKEQEEIYPYIVNVLFHELSHAHTLPDINISSLKEFDEKNNYSELGYIFWREFIANYIGNKTFINTCGNINYIDNIKELKEKSRKTLIEVKNDNITNLDELISYILLSKHNILNYLKDNVLDEKKYRIFIMLLELCKNYVNIKDLENINITQLNELGKLIHILTTK